LGRLIAIVLYFVYDVTVIEWHVVGSALYPRMSERHLEPPLEMDALPAQSPEIGKPHTPHKLAQRNYAIGICLLLLVVLLWTTSSFVTQVRL
jgi:hypothetical protein